MKFCNYIYNFLKSFIILKWKPLQSIIPLIIVEMIRFCSVLHSNIRACTCTSSILVTSQIPDISQAVTLFSHPKTNFRRLSEELSSVRCHYNSNKMNCNNFWCLITVFLSYLPISQKTQIQNHILLFCVILSVVNMQRDKKLLRNKYQEETSNTFPAKIAFRISTVLFLALFKIYQYSLLHELIECKFSDTPWVWNKTLGAVTFNIFVNIKIQTYWWYPPFLIISMPKGIINQSPLTMSRILNFFLTQCMQSL